MKNKDMQVPSNTTGDLQTSLTAIRSVLGDDLNLEKVKYFLQGADGNVEIALNHLLNSLEKEEQWNHQFNTTVPSLEKVLTELAEEVKCPLCLGYFQHPVALGCFHTFCTSCLEELVSEDNAVACPLCRANFQLGTVGVRGLKPNHYLANIVEKIKAAQSTKMCVECRNQICSVFCKECDVFLCNECNTKIHSGRLLALHHRTPYEDCFFNLAKRTKVHRTVNDRMRDLDYVIPLNVKKEVCVDLFASWVKELWFAPTDLLRKAIMEDFQLLYIPYWLFEVETFSRYSVMLGYGQKDPHWVSSLGTTSNRFTDLMVAACDCPEAQLLTNLEPWKVDQLQPFTLKHTDSAEVLPFSMEDDVAWTTQGKSKMDQMCREVCEQKLRKSSRADNLQNVQIETTFSNKRARRVFVPVYSAAFTYRGNMYRFVVNGSTAKVHGTRPFSGNKLASIGVTGIGAVLGFLTTKLG